MKKTIKKNMTDEFQMPDRGLITEYVRGKLFFVFNVTDDIKPDKKIVLKHVNVSNPVNFRRPSTVIEIDGKNIRVPAQTIHATEVKRYKSGSILISETNFNHLRWSRAVKQLSEHELAWVNYCYGDKLDFDFQIIICRYVWLAFEKFLYMKNLKLRKNTVILLHNLTWLIVQNCVYQIKNNRNLYNQTQLASLSQKSLSSWLHHYSQFCNHLHSICYQLDREALIHVDRLFRCN